MPLTLTLNGQPRVFEGLGPETDLTALVTELRLKGDRIALELNGAIVSRTKWGETVLRTGDRLELVHFVGGGASLLR